MIKYARWFFTCALVYASWKEAGIFTALNFFLIFATMELITVWIKETTEILNRKSRN
jgi:hypothetical protein